MFIVHRKQKKYFIDLVEKEVRLAHLIYRKNPPKQKKAKNNTIAAQPQQPKAKKQSVPEAPKKKAAKGKPKKEAAREQGTKRKMIKREVGRGAKGRK